MYKHIKRVIISCEETSYLNNFCAVLFLTIGMYCLCIRPTKRLTNEDYTCSNGFCSDNYCELSLRSIPAGLITLVTLVSRSPASACYKNYKDSCCEVLISLIVFL